MLTLNLYYIKMKYNSGYHTYSIQFYSIMFWFTSTKIRTNKLGRVISQSEVENKMAPYRQEHNALIQTSTILVAGYQIFCYRRQSCNIFA